MPQHRIKLEPGKVYHIWTHANGSDDLFSNQENYRYFLEKYSLHIYPVVETFAYCLMPNHLHLMIRVRSEDELTAFYKIKNPNSKLENFSGLVSQQFSNLFNAYTKAYNKLNTRKGSLFIPNFGRKLVDNDSYFTQLIAYIHNNPIHHGFTNNLNDWQHSSWHSYLLDQPTKICRNEGLNWFGAKEEFLKLHREFKKKDVILELE